MVHNHHIVISYVIESKQPEPALPLRWIKEHED